MTKTAYIQHGKSGEPMRTEKVEVKEALLAWQKQGLQYTASGYGKRIPTRYMVKTNNRWRRVYCVISSNVGTLYVGTLGKGALTVTINGEA